MGLTHGSLFTGIGGFDLGFQWAGIRTVFQVEIDEYCRRLLEKRFPDARRYADIRAFATPNSQGDLRRASGDEGPESSDGPCADVPYTEGIGRREGRPESDGRGPIAGESSLPRVDIISGGFPCQPVSQAGKRQGAADDRYLWPEMFRVVQSLRPRWVVAENVYGLITHEGGELLDKVYDDLAGEGYETLPPIVLPACAFGAPHRRDRVWIVAHRECNGSEAGISGQNTRQEGITGIPINGSPLCDAAATRLPDGSGIALAGSRQEPQPERSDWWATEPRLGRETDGLPTGLDRLDVWGEGWEDGIPRVARKIPNRVARLRGLGNAIVPEIACLLGRLIAEADAS